MAENIQLSQVNRFIETLDETLSVSQIEKSFSNVINELGFKESSYTIHKVKSDCSEESVYSLTNHSIDQWDTHYWKENYANIDHIAKRTCKMMLPYAWDLKEAHEENFQNKKFYNQ
jgi:hypothetical protein